MKGMSDTSTLDSSNRILVKVSTKTIKGDIMLLFEQETLDEIIKTKDLTPIIKFLNKLGFTELANEVSKILAASCQSS